MNTEDDNVNYKQQPIGFNGNQQGNRTSGVGSGGGGGLPGGGGSGSFGSTGDGGGRAKSGLNTDTLHGVGGGGGYSVSGMGFQSGGGGFRGYGNGRAEKGKSDKFNLKKYLPSALNGRSLKRTPAGLAAGHRDISGAGGDIFQKISNRYRIMCAQGRFIGCERGSN